MLVSNVLASNKNHRFSTHSEINRRITQKKIQEFDFIYISFFPPFNNMDRSERINIVKQHNSGFDLHFSDNE